MELHRRGLITGLVCLIGAPAIIRAESLMAIKSIIYDRWLCCYNSGMDQMMVRYDAANYELRIPPMTGVEIVPEPVKMLASQVHRESIKNARNFAKMAGQQFTLHFEIPRQVFEQIG